MRANYGETLRRIRGTKTLEEVAQTIGITAAALKGYEEGERTPSDDIKIKLCNYYNAWIDELFPSLDMTDSEILEVFERRPEILALLKAYDQIPDERKHEAFTLIMERL